MASDWQPVIVGDKNVHQFVFNLSVRVVANEPDAGNIFASNLRRALIQQIMAATDEEIREAARLEASWVRETGEVFARGAEEPFEKPI